MSRCLRPGTAMMGTAVAISMAVAACAGVPAGSRSTPPAADTTGLGQATPSPSPTPATESTQRVPPTLAASATPTATPSAGLGPPSGSAPPAPSASSALPHADADLEAFLPASLSGTSLIRFSSAGSVFTAGSDVCILVCGDEPYRYAKQLGVDIDRVTVAFAVDERLAIGMIAYRARGAPTEALIPARIAIGGYTGHTDMRPRAVTVAGRPATYLDAGFMTNGEYLMTRHGALFIVLGEAPATDGAVPAYVTEALGKLP